jgi:hypothetical protein
MGLLRKRIGLWSNTGFMSLRDGCLLLRDGCLLLRNGCLLLRNGCLLLRNGCLRCAFGHRGFFAFAALMQENHV